MTLPARTPVEVEARGLRRRFRHSTRYGPMYFLEIEVQKELWDAAEGIPDAALIGGHLWWHDGDPVGDEKPAVTEATELQEALRERKRLDPGAPDGIGFADAFDGVAEAYEESDGPAQPLPLPEKAMKDKPGPWSAYWERMFIKQFYTFPALLEELHVKGVVNLSGRVRKELRSRFSVDSLTQVSPCRMEAWLCDKRMPQDLIQKSIRSVEELGGDEYRWGKDKQEGTAA